MLLVGGLISIFTISIFAQRADSVKSEQPLKQCSGEKFVMPQSIRMDGSAFTNFIKVMSLSRGERQKAFSNLLNEEKADVFKVQLALNFTKRSNLTKEQKTLILDSISLVSADTYNKENSELIAKSAKQAEEIQQKALAIFPPNEAYEIFASLNGENSSDIEFLKKYEEILTLPMRARKQMIRASAPAEKSDFWKAQMIYYLATANLSSAQKSFITEVFPLMTSNSFLFPAVKGQTKNEETKALEAYVAKGFELFSKEEFFTIFMGYGIHKTVFEKTLIEYGTRKSAFETILVKAANLQRTCDCNYVCGIGETCTVTSCSVSKDGCGIFGGTECESFCLSNS